MNNVGAKNNKIINCDEIKEYLPQRYPFLFVDRVIDYELGKSICGIKNITRNEDFFNGHFPRQLVMPGVLQIEALAQISGILYFLTTDTRPSDENFFYFAGIDNARFKRVVCPGDQLLLHSEMLRNKLGIWVFSVKATVDGELTCSAELRVAKGEVRHD